MLSLHIEQNIRPASGLPKNVGRSLRTQVVLGSPSAGCRDVGVCRVIPADIELSVKCPVLNAWMSMTETGKLRIGFEYDTLSVHTFHRHFRWGLFQVLEPCEMPLFVCRFLKLESVSIQTGVYPVFLKGSRLVVDFNIQPEGVTQSKSI